MPTTTMHIPSKEIPTPGEIYINLKPIPVTDTCEATLKARFMKDPIFLEGTHLEDHMDTFQKELLAAFPKKPMKLGMDFLTYFGFQMKLLGVNWRETSQLFILMDWFRVHGVIRLYVDEKSQLYFCLNDPVV